MTTMSIGELAKTMGISVRTLRYYDAVDLLKPAAVTKSGYRFYDGESLSVLQQILFFRELEFSLEDIRNILSNPDYDRKQILEQHRELLLLKRRHLDELLRMVDETIGGEPMRENKITYADVEAAKKRYADEVRPRWGGTDAYRESEQKHAGYGVGQETEAVGQMEKLLALFAAERMKSPAAPEVQALVECGKQYITAYHYNGPDEILSALGQMYASDERFAQNIDRFGQGTARFMSGAIAFYCSR